MKKIILPLLAFFAFGLQAQTEEAQGFDNWDMDDDGYLSSEEFRTGWDEEGVFDDWDLDSDGAMTQDEWNEGSESYYSDTDGYMGNDDFDFEAWDENEDGVLNEDEFNNGTYSLWDEDDNDLIDDSEYNDYYSYEEPGFDDEY